MVTWSLGGKPTRNLLCLLVYFYPTDGAGYGVRCSLAYGLAEVDLPCRRIGHLVRTHVN
jgi:hypothetical protein